ncbi:T9SS type A sorting domain-containing protein [Flavobacteriaceae bacterium Ap0902]|nr:T9SS type A sorting domain-containing protein [Flavobacteriaceae bacterium Ap0902]
MKQFLLLFFAASMAFAQQSVSLSLEAGYENDVFYKFSDQQTHFFDRNEWDVAFYRVSNYDQGIRVNEGKGLALYEASNDINDWNNIDFYDIPSFTVLHNSDEDWKMGAFNQGSATYGWGEYNMSNHHLVGSVIFVIGNMIDGSVYKFMIEDYFGGYTIKYALWDGNAWGSDMTNFVSNTENTDRFFNYLKLSTNELVVASPETNAWDLKFTKYSTLVTNNNGEEMPYTVTGVLQNPNVTVAQVEGEATDISNLDYSEDINTIGYDWKSLNSNWEYEIVPNQFYYVKSEDTVYRMVFESFEGSSTGNLTFNYQEESLSTLDIKGNTKFAVYPNPVTNKEITLVYDNAEYASNDLFVELYNLAGQKVYETKLNRGSGLFQRTIQLNNLSQGTYILRVISGCDVRTEKLLIK